MPQRQITLHHDGLDADCTVPMSTVAGLKRSGWKVVEGSDEPGPAAATPEKTTAKKAASKEG